MLGIHDFKNMNTKDKEDKKQEEMEGGIEKKGRETRREREGEREKGNGLVKERERKEKGEEEDTLS